MLDSLSSIRVTRLAIALVISVGLLASSGCDVPGLKSKVTVPPLLGPLAEADTGQLLAEVNRTAALRSIRGKIDIQFLDTSFAECGVAEKYRTADGTVTLQRPGQIYLVIQTPFVNYSVAEMTSDGERFRVAVLMGDEKYRRFVRGSNGAVYPKLEANGKQAECGNDEKKRKVTQQQAVSALSGLRPQHFTDALLILPAAEADSNLVYARTEQFEEEADSRPRAKANARVVRGYYVLDELAPAGEGRLQPVRRFWFDRFEKIKLARLQTFDQTGQLTTDVVYKEPKSFGEDGRYVLPSRIELTRPQDRYSLRISYQAPEAVVVDREYNPKTFMLDNKWQLPVVDLDARGASAKSQ